MLIYDVVIIQFMLKINPDAGSEYAGILANITTYASGLK
jgi:hypothetical protein